MDLVPKMPAYLDIQAQLSIEYTNETNSVISIRWVVEALNGQLKKWRTLNKRNLKCPNTIYCFRAPDLENWPLCVLVVGGLITDGKAAEDALRYSLSGALW
ncbi:hypothetical protein TNCV_4112771 [Trichonephila clavipes]|nr:hypothetical protein TNCV_4112771 [Trichonephila clavipes]